jgi:hypothetical protein
MDRAALSETKALRRQPAQCHQVKARIFWSMLETQPCKPSLKNLQKIWMLRKKVWRKHGADRFVWSGSARFSCHFLIRSIYGTHGTTVARLRYRGTVRSLNQASADNCWRSGISAHPQKLPTLQRDIACDDVITVGHLKYGLSSLININRCSCDEYRYVFFSSPVACAFCYLSHHLDLLLFC